MRILLTIIIGMALTGAAHAEIYKCTENGTTFSQTPCAADAERVDVQVYRPSNEEVAAGRERSERSQEQNRRLGIDREKRRILLEIGEVEKDILVVHKSRERELAALRREQGRANNNLAGAVYHQGLAEQMNAVTQKYDSLLRLNQDRISRLREDLRRLDEAQ
jgi:hypothetical protein